MDSNTNSPITPGRLVPYKLKVSQVKHSPPTKKAKVSSPKIRRTLNTTYTCTVSSYEDENGKELALYMAMANINITPTGFPTKKKLNELCHKVELMCGEISHSYTSKTTHILAGHAKTNKVELGRMRNIPIITAEWIEQLWEACTHENNPYIHASLPKYRDYECPLFYNINFYFSKHYDPDTRLFYEKAVKDKGGVVVSNLTHFNSSYYICQKHENEGTYRYALGNGIPCVSATWISESIHLNMLAPVDGFEVQLRPRRPLGETFIVGKKGDSEEDLAVASPDRCEEEKVTEEPPTVSRKRNRMSSWEGDSAQVLLPQYSGYDSGSDSDSSTHTLNATSIYSDDTLIDDTFTDDTLTSVAG